LAFYFVIFWLPTIASLLLLVRLWNEGELMGRGAALCACWFLLSLCTQYFAWNPALWAVGLVSQTGLAIFMSVKWKNGS